MHGFVWGAAFPAAELGHATQNQCQGTAQAGSSLGAMGAPLGSGRAGSSPARARPIAL